MDSTSDLSDQEMRIYDIKSLHSYFEFEEKTYCSYQISSPQLVDMVYGTNTLPVSHPPTVDDFQEAFRDLLDTRDEVISFHLSRQLSQSFENAQIAAQKVAPHRITVIDSTMGSYAMGLLALRARRMAEAGESTRDIVRFLEKNRSNQFVRFTLDTVEFLRLSKRVSNLGAFFATLFGVKPVFGYKNGYIKPFGRTRGTEKAILKIATDFVRYSSQYGRVRVIFLYSPGGEDSAHLLKNTLLDWGLRFEDHGFRMICSPFTLVTGPRGLGIIAEPVYSYTGDDQES